MKTILVRFTRDEFGTTVIEYGLLSFLISLGIIGALTIAGSALSVLYAAIGNMLTAAI